MPPVKITSRICLNEDIGVHGNMFGGRLMELMDEAAAIYAMQTTGEHRVVSRKFSGVEFCSPVKHGDILEFMADRPKRGRTSFMFDIEVFVQGTVRFQASCVFVAIDEQGHKKEIQWPAEALKNIPVIEPKQNFFNDRITMITEEMYQQRLPKIRKVAVFLGATVADDPVYTQAAVEFGRFLAEHDMTLVYGGSEDGTMKILADTVMQNGGKTIGVFTKDLPVSRMRKNLTETVITDNLSARKTEMLRLADAVVALPGSIGTVDELFEALALRKIGSGYRCPVGVLNVNGFFDSLFDFLQHTLDTGFTAPRYAGLLKTGKTPDELFHQLCGALDD